MWISRLTFVFLILLVIDFNTAAQEFGGNPLSLKWKQINTDTVRVIFPPGLEKEAADITSIVHQLANRTQLTIGNKLRKVDIVLQNQTTNANGYAGLGPFRSEFFLTPSQNSFQLGSLPWHKTLALHEYRHVQQFNNFRKGLSEVFYIIFGEDGLSLANSMAIPDWFWEGDAVYQETLLSGQGRGEFPYFFNDYRSLWAAQKDYSWMKLRNGSLRDFVPDHYRLGYMLVAYGRKKYGDHLWAKVTSDAASYKGLTYPFQRAIKKYTGEDFRSFRKKAIQYFEDSSPDPKEQPYITDNPFSSPVPRPQSAEADTPFSLPAPGSQSHVTANPSASKAQTPVADTPSAHARQHKHFYADEEFPHWMDGRHIVYVKRNYKMIPAFYSRDIISGFEKKIRVKDISIDNYFSYRNGRIVYSAYRPDIRWGWKNYGVIRIVDALTGEQKTLTKESRYLSPDISQDGSRVIAVHTEPGGKNELHVIDASSGKLLSAIPNPDQWVFTYPKFYMDDKIVTAVRNIKGEMSLAVLTLSTGKVIWSTRFTGNVIAFPNVSRDTIYFSMSRDGQDKLFAVIGQKIYHFKPAAVNAYTGNYQLSSMDGKFAWTAFTAVGYFIQYGDGRFEELEKPFEETAENTYRNKRLADNPYPDTGFADSPSATRLADNPYPGTLSQVGPDLIQDSISTSYPISKYSKSLRLFNFHSWRPYINDPEYSYSLISQNILNTLQSEFFFTYNRNENYKEAGAALAYGGFFPVIRGGAAYTFDRSFRDSNTIINWNEINANVGLTVPLQFSRGSYFRNITISGSVNTKQLNYSGKSKSLYEDKRFNYGELALTFTNQRLRARQNIYPRFAQTLLTRHRSILSKYSGYQFLASGSFYLPGLFTNHSLMLQASYQRRDTLQQYHFSNGFPFSRGYSNFDFPRMWKFSANYHFPLSYPDMGFGNIVYLLRVRGNVFYDHTVTKSLQSGNQFPFKTAGGEIYFDSKWWNQLPVSFGFRYSRLLDNDVDGRSANQWEFVLPVNLLSR